VLEAEVGLVKYGDFSLPEARANGGSPGSVMFWSQVENGKAWKERLQIQTQMKFGGGFAAAVFCPAHTIGYQPDDSGIDCVNALLESVETALALNELRTLFLQIIQETPKKFLSHIAIANLVCVR
jgi:hypothetical protein